MLNPIPPVANAIWQAAGRPEGTQDRDYFAAKRVILAYAYAELLRAIADHEAAGLAFPAPCHCEIRRRGAGVVAEELTDAVLRGGSHEPAAADQG